MGTGLGKVLSGVALAVLSLGTSTVGYAAEEATLTARAAATQRVDFDVFLPIEHKAELDSLLASQQDSKSPLFHKWLKPAEFNARFGVSEERLGAIESELRSHGLTVTRVAPRQMHVTGAAKNVEETFQSELKTGSFPSGRPATAFPGRFELPSSILAADGVVTGLSGKIRMQEHSIKTPIGTGQKAPENRYGEVGPYWFTDLKQAYSFPSYQAYNGAGVVIGVLMSGDYLPADMTKYFGHEKIAPPSILEYKVAGGAKFGGRGSQEASLDLQQTGGMAPKATLLLFNIPDLSDSSILSGLVTAVEFDITDVLSMSFGGPEKQYAPEYNGGQSYLGILKVYDDLFAQGNAQGMTFVASSGDSGALAIPPVACLEPGATSSCGKMQPSVNTPASSPHVTGVGGTNLLTQVAPSVPLYSAYKSENADDDPLIGDIFYGTPATGAVWGSGGGDSIYYKKPPFQTLVSTGSNFRTVPDVSLHMGGCPYMATVAPCPPDRSSDILVYNDLYYQAIGTSASAPDFAGLVALKVQRDQSRQGNINYELYVDAFEQNLGIVSGIFRENIPGYNGYYSTKPGYDRVLGIGTVRGLNFLKPPAGTPVAGVPQTPSNP